MSPRVILAESKNWLSGARLAWLLGRHGVSVTAFAGERGLLSRSKSLAQLEQYPLTISGTDWLKRLAALIAEVNPDMVIACDEHALQLILRLTQMLHPKGEQFASIVRPMMRGLSSPDYLAAIVSKMGMNDVARSAGLQVPEWQVARSFDDVVEVFERYGGVAIKWDLGAGGSGVTLCSSRDELSAAYLDNVARADSIFVQRRIHGADHFHTFVALDGKYLAGYSARALASFPDQGPPTVLGKVDAELDKRIAGATRKLVSAGGLSGFGGMDYIVDESGEIWFLEVNRHPVNPAAGLAFGVDLGLALADGLCGREYQWAGDPESDIVAIQGRERDRDPQSSYLEYERFNRHGLEDIMDLRSPD